MPAIDLDGESLHYMERGSGPHALFIHGFPLDSTMWLDQMERLSDQRRCIAVDLRGFGASCRVTDGVLPMERHAADLDAVLGRLAIHRVDVVALSMGGYVALALAQLYPDRLRTLALVDTKSGPDSAEGREGRDLAIRRLLTDGRRHFAIGLISSLVAPGASDIVKARLRTMIEATPYETMIASLAAMRDRPDRSGILGRIEVPTAVIVGEHDAITPPSAAREMADLLPNGTLHIIPDAGHMSPMETPDAVATTLRTLWANAD